MLLVMSGDQHEEEGPVGFVGQSDSWHSMSTSYGTRDMISLVTPRLGG
jgi:hypothetical protein